MSIDHQRLREILAEAAARQTPEARTAYLDGACGEDEALRAEAERVLALNAQMGSFLECPAAPTRPDSNDEQPGMIIGQFKLIEPIGEGTFGRVFVAEQREPVRRKVALKIVKAGMDTREVVARFEAERQALALMDHPNIAKVLDAGTTEAGRPYFAMELVRGIPITDYCDHQNLGMPERLRLLMDVCHAVQHAHQKAVIHRDLKPTNILVTEIDGKPMPKVIDFGVAKALGQQLTERTLYTAFQQVVGTPAYMSPEQTALNGSDVDTRSDVYSLGVLLYELLTGVTPIDTETLRQAGLDEIRRMIRETEPPKPSQRLRTLGDRLPEIARHRHAEPSTLTRQLGGDLDWIVMRSLEKERARRYETASALARDVERYLGNEPVEAGPPSALYRLRKYIRRHRVGVVLTATLVVAGLVCIAALGIGMVRVRQERDRAVAAEERAAFEAAISQAAVNAVAYSEQGEPAKAQEILEEILPIMRGVRGPEHPDSLRTMHQLASAYSDQGKPGNAQKILEEVLLIQRRVLGPEHPERLFTMYKLANAFSGQGRISEAQEILEEALPIMRQAQGYDYRNTLRAMHNLADIYRDQGRNDEAIQIREQALELCGTVSGPGDSWTLEAIKELARSYEDEGRILDSLPLLAEVCAREPENTFRAMKLGSLQVWFGMRAEHDATRRRLLAWATIHDGATNAQHVTKLTCMRPIEDAEMRESTLSLARTAVKLYGNNQDGRLPWFQMALGMAEYRAGQYREAAQTFATISLANLWPRNKTAFADGILGFYRAMSLFHLGHTAEARALFVDTEAKMVPLPENAEDPLVAKHENFDLLMQWNAYREAKALLGKPGTATESLRETPDEDRDQPDSAGEPAEE